MKKIIIIDYGCGNIESIKRGFNHIGEECKSSNEIAEINSATHLILPGVGSFKKAMLMLKNSNLIPTIINHHKQDKPLLGICLGMQLLFNKSTEFGETEGLGIFSGEVIKLENNDRNKFKIPNIGWYNLNGSSEKSKIGCLNFGKYYHVHSYYCKPSDQKNITHYINFNNKKICVSYKYKNNLGVQFHPEKSREDGLKFLKFFTELK